MLGFEVLKADGEAQVGWDKGSWCGVGLGGGVDLGLRVGRPELGVQN